MAPARKSRRQSKLPVKLQDFVFEDGQEKKKIEITPEKKKKEKNLKTPKKKDTTQTERPEKKQYEDSHEPRRSGRTPKLSEKLKSYLNDKGDAKKEKNESTVKKQARKSSGGNVSSVPDVSDLKEPKVVLKKLHISSLPTKSAKHQMKSSEGLIMKDRVNPSYQGRDESCEQSAEKKKLTKRKLDTECELIAESIRKSSSYIKKSRISNGSSEKHEAEELHEETVESVKQINKDMMTQLLNFGAEIAEAMASNNDKMQELTAKEGISHNPLHTFKIEGNNDFDEDEVKKILEWLQKEEEQRGLYRKKIIDSMRASHDSNMALFTQLLDMLQSLSSSLRC